MTESNTPTTVRWTKSSYSDGGSTCVELASSQALLAVRDSKVPASPTLAFPVAAGTAFLAALAV
ncbi:DUF397 domain-containing protein [Embleya sp. NPDC005971]|uniref:DUF397 domain-containing protein n=1 Tax=Embleya sp. NPDC005971 TaxID=3156724 RepID=UPI0033FFF333